MDEQKILLIGKKKILNYVQIVIIRKKRKQLTKWLIILQERKLKGEKIKTI
jgi:hypothetical protein